MLLFKQKQPFTLNSLLSNSFCISIYNTDNTNNTGGDSMLLEIDEQSEQPIYQQLIDQIIVGIAKGELVPNESLPSIRQLADEIGVNMMTVSKAYNKLKQSGYIVTDRRNGTKIAAKLPATAVWQQQLHERLELLLAESFLHQQSEAEIQALIQKIYQNFDSKGRAL